jgi:hypothetical protein
MKPLVITFDSIVEFIYKLPFEDRLELQNLLEHNIAETRRNEISDNYKKALDEYNSGSLVFSSEVNELKTLL